MNKAQLVHAIQNAARMGQRAAEIRLETMQARGPVYAVRNVDPFTGAACGPAIGTMLDVCGFAWVTIPGLSRRTKAIKELISEGLLSYSHYEKRVQLHISTHRQEIGVNEAACERAAEVLNALGIKAYPCSRID